MATNKSSNNLIDFLTGTTIFTILIICQTLVGCTVTTRMSLGDEDLLNKSNTHYESQEYKEAMDDYNKAIQLQPNDTDAYGNRGKAKYDLKDYKGATLILIKLSNLTLI